MANVSRPSGLSPVAYLNGTPWNGQVRMYYIASDDGNAFAIGDPLALTGTASASGVAGVTLATAGTANPVLGALMGMGGSVEAGMYGDPNNLNTIVIPATKTHAYWVAVADDPNIIFEIQESTTGAALTVADVGSNANLLSGTNNGYLSGWQFNNSTLAVTATLQLQLLGLTQRQDNAFGASAKWLARINNHAYKAGTAGV